MSTAANKQEKVTLEESKSAKIGFENAPKLFSKWNYDDIKVSQSSCRSLTHASSTTSLPLPPRPKFSYPTLPADTKPKSSERLSAPSSRDLWDRCSSTAEIRVKKWKRSASCVTLSRSSTSSPEETPWKCSSTLWFKLDPGKTPPESERAVWWESRQSTFPLWEESIRPSTWSPRELGSTLSDPKRASPRCSPTSWSTLRRATCSPPMLWRRRKKSKKWPRVTAECCTTNLIFSINPIIYASIIHPLACFCHLWEAQ